MAYFPPEQQLTTELHKVLIHHMSWMNLEFLQTQASGPDLPLDLSEDHVFLLAGGVRQVFLLCMPYFRSNQSVFITAASYKPCDVLRDIIDRRGVDWRRTANRFMALYDDPTYSGGRGGAPTALSTLPVLLSCRAAEGHHDVGDAYAALYATSPDLSPDRSVTRFLFEHAVSRLAVILAFIAEGPPASDDLLLPPPRRADFERYFLTFPVVCFLPLQQLIFVGDSRALVMLYHFYRAARVLIGTEESWWSVRRSMVMERLIRDELKVRGVDARQMWSDIFSSSMV